MRLSDICNLLGRDWIPLAKSLEIPESDINLIETEYPGNTTQQAMVMLRLWMTQSENRVTGNSLEKALRKIGRDDIVNQCIFNVELVTDDLEKAVAKVQLDQTGFDSFREEIGSSRNATLRRNTSLDVSFDEQDLMKVRSRSLDGALAAVIAISAAATAAATFWPCRSCCVRCSLRPRQLAAS